MKPPMIPHQGRAIDTVNFRNVKESASSMDMGNGPSNGVSKDGLLGLSGSALKGVPLDSGIATPAGELADPFEEFNSVTLHHDGEDSHQGHHHDSGGGGSGSGSGSGRRR